jgi:hypothetical protein
MFFVGPNNKRRRSNGTETHILKIWRKSSPISKFFLPLLLELPSFIDGWGGGGAPGKMNRPGNGRSEAVNWRSCHCEYVYDFRGLPMDLII